MESQQILSGISNLASCFRRDFFRIALFFRAFFIFLNFIGLCLYLIITIKISLQLNNLLRTYEGEGRQCIMKATSGDGLRLSTRE